MLAIASKSLPTRERELKRHAPLQVGGVDRSLPTRERELKHVEAKQDEERHGRSLHGSVN